MTSTLVPGLAASNNIILKTNLRRFSHFLNVGHINVQSLKPSFRTGKFDELQCIMEGHYLDVLACSETWAKSYMTNKALSIDGYKLLRNDRPGIRGGGVACYISDKLKSRVIDKSVYTRRDQLEYLLVEIGAGQDRVLLGVFYFPNRNDRDLSEAESILQNFSVRYKNIILLGDFNNNLLNSNILNRNNNFFQRHNLTIVHNSAPTHYDLANNSVSLLDFIVVSDVNRVVFHDQFWVHGLSHHAFIYMSYNIESTCSPREFVHRDYNSIDMHTLLHHCSLIDFGYIYNTANVDDQLVFINTVIISLFNKYVPLKKFKPRNFSRRRSQSLDNLKSLRDLAFKAYSLDKTDANRRIYCHYRNKCNAKCRQIKYNYGISAFDRKLTVKQIWQRIGELGVLSDTQSLDAGLIPDDLNKHFATVQTLSGSTVYDDEIVESNDSFAFRNFELDELVLAFESIKSNAVGIDSIPIKFLKIIFPLFAPHFLYFFNSIITTSKFPSEWKSAKVIPVAKINNPIIPSDFRPISLLPVLSKVWEKLVKDQITSSPFVQKNLFLGQSGFRPLHSTTTAILDLTENIRTNLDKKLVSFLLLLDFSKAFDSVEHIVLCHKLKKLFSFSSSACDLIYSYLCGRKQRTVIGDNVSAFLPLSRGVPQGSILGPILFLLFINDLPSIIKCSSAHIFADDVQLLFVTTPNMLRACVADINIELVKVTGWAAANGLFINPDKSQACVFNHSPISHSCDPIVLNNTSIQYCSKVKSLGFILDEQLSLTNHVNEIISKTTFTLRKLYSINNYLPRYIRIKLFHALFMPYFNYGPEVYAGTSSGNIDRLRVAFNSALRFTFGLKRSCHSLSPISKMLIGTTFHKFLYHRNLLLLYKIVNRNTPKYLLNRLKFSTLPRYPQNLIVPMHAGTYMAQSFIIRNWKLWNAIDFKEIKPIGKFKVKLLEFLNKARIDVISGVNRLAWR